MPSRYLTRYLAKELGSRGIRANVVAPGAIETDFTKGAFAHHPEMKGFLASQTALGRVGVPDDIGGVVAFLCSEEGRWVNAQRSGSFRGNVPLGANSFRQGAKSRRIASLSNASETSIDHEQKRRETKSFLLLEPVAASGKLPLGCWRARARESSSAPAARIVSRNSGRRFANGRRGAFPGARRHQARRRSSFHELRAEKFTNASTWW